MNKKLILDVNMSGGDYAAIYVAAMLEDNALAGVITTAGEKTALQAKYEAEKLLKKIGKENIPVYAGAEGPIKRDNFYRPSSIPCGGHGNGAAAYMELLEKNSGDIVAVLTGGASNVAQLISCHPEAAEKIKSIIFTGGCFAYGDITPVASRNAYYDPEALEIAAGCGKDFYLIPLELTQKLNAGEKEKKKLNKLLEKDCDKLEMASLTALNAALKPESYGFGKYKCGVETEGDFVRGMTVVYLNGFDYAETRTDGSWVRHDVKPEDKNCFYPAEPSETAIRSELNELLGTEA